MICLFVKLFLKIGVKKLLKKYWKKGHESPQKSYEYDF